MVAKKFASLRNIFLNCRQELS